MPKRVATPPPGDDEPKYVTVVQPFPLNAHWELPLDRQEFARWIACCIGTESFYAFFYKPRAALTMVIVEIERTYGHFERVLGEHRWCEILKNPNEEEEGRVSRVFHCFYNSNREVQKDGWKRINVEDSWFKGWSPTDWRIVHPYPSTHWCAVPKEDRTNKSLCRPLPVQTFPPPVKAPPPVVGSSGWADAKSAPSRTPKATRAPSGRPLVIATRNNTSQTAAKKSAGSRLATPSSAASPSTSNRGTPTPSSWASPTSEMARDRDCSSPVSSIRSPTSSPFPPFPPGLGPLPARQPSISAWEDSAASPTPYPAPPGLTRNNNQGSISGGAAVIGQSFNDNAQVSNTIHFQKSNIESALDSMTLEDSPIESNYVAPWECPEGPVPLEPVWEQTGEPEALESLWDNYDALPSPPPILCTAHGLICKRGICLDYDKQMKAIERANRAESGRGRGTRGRGGERGGRRSNRKGKGSGNSDWTGSLDGDDSRSSWGDEENDTGADASGVEGSTKGRGRAHSKAESVATTTSDGWDDTSNGPW